MKRESKLLYLAGADPKEKGRTGHGRMKANVLQCSGEEKSTQEGKVRSEIERLEGKIA